MMSRAIAVEPRLKERFEYSRTNPCPFGDAHQVFGSDLRYRDSDFPYYSLDLTAYHDLELIAIYLNETLPVEEFDRLLPRQFS